MAQEVVAAPLDKMEPLAETVSRRDFKGKPLASA
jgi:hypothetical protein